MNLQTQRLFLALIFAQVLHSIEEILFSLWAVFAPARAVARLFSSDPAVGFMLANGAVILFAVWCYVARIKPRHSAARGWILFWTGLELLNGLGHPMVALVRGAYVPGVATAPLLVILSWLLARDQIRNR